MPQVYVRSVFRGTRCRVVFFRVYSHFSKKKTEICWVENEHAPTDHRIMYLQIWSNGQIHTGNVKLLII